MKPSDNYNDTPQPSDNDRRQAMDRLKDLEEKMEERGQCDGCHSGYVICREHGEMAVEIADIKRFYNLD